MTSRARTGTVTVPRALLIVLSGTLLATLLAVAFLLGREAGRTETAAPDLLAEASPAPVEPAPAEPAVDPRERAAVARYFEEFDEIAGSNAGAGNSETMAMALLSQATGGDWSRFDELGDTQRVMLRRLRGLRVPPVCREYHQKMITLLEAGAALLDDVRQGGAVRQFGCLEHPHDDRPAAAGRRRGGRPPSHRHPAALRNLKPERRERLHRTAKAVAPLLGPLWRTALAVRAQA